MRFIVLRHQEEEGLGTIADWLQLKGHAYYYVNLFAGQKPPANALMAHDGLVSMGGPMSVNDDSDLMKTSLAVTADFVQANRPVLGVCLGAQAIARVSGGSVTRSAFELGFDRVQPVAAHRYFSQGKLPQTEWDVFQWHGENFSLPPGSQHLFSGSVVANQGFTYKNALGMQFHNELSLSWYTMWYESLRHKFENMDQLKPPSAEMPFVSLQQNLFALLDTWMAQLY